MYLTKEGIDLIKSWEGCRLTAYRCPAGKWTIGYGITSDAGLGPVTRGMKITQAQADEWLIQSLAKYEEAVRRALLRHATPPQFSAMVSLCFNIGPSGFASSTVVSRFNAGRIDAATAAFHMWNKATVNGKRVVLKGLVDRRIAEARLFKTEVSFESVVPATLTPATPNNRPGGSPPNPVPTSTPPSTLWQRIVDYFRNTF